MPKWLKFTLIALAAGGVGLIIYAFPVIVMLISIMTAKIEVYDDVSSYEEYLAYADRDGKNKWSKWDMDESIWPRKITETMNVRDFKMVYYNPWDAQYLGYLVVDYTPEEYAEGANKVINNKNSLHKTEAEDGDDVYYLEETNEFVIVSTDGYIRTYFKPTQGIDYFFNT